MTASFKYMSYLLILNLAVSVYIGVLKVSAVNTVFSKQYNFIH